MSWPQAPPKGGRARTFSRHNAAGEPRPPADLAGGQPVIAILRAAWCPYCRALTPLLSEIRLECPERGGQVLALNVREDGDPVACLRERGADAVAAGWGIRGTPGLFDGNGMVGYRRRSGPSRPGPSRPGPQS